LNWPGQNGAEVLNYHEVKVREALMEMTAGIGPDSCIDAVGMEAHGFSPDNIIDAIKQETKIWARTALTSCARPSWRVRKGGTVSVPGVYGGDRRQMADRRFHGEGPDDLKTGQTHVQKLSAAAPRADPGGQDRHHRSDQPPAAAGAGRRGLQELQGKPERMDQGRAEAARLINGLRSLSLP
jgi:hypothetical protein